MQLYTVPHSPYVRKVRMLVRELGLLEQVTEIATTTSPLDPDPVVAGLNPTMRVPVLVRENGAALYDSRVITRYLDDVAEGGFYPSARLWEVLAREAAVEGIMDSAFAMAIEMRLRPQELRWEAGLEAHWAKVSNALDAFERDWPEVVAHGWDMSLIAMACALAYLDFRHGARGWRNGRPRLATWFAAVEARPSFMATQESV